MRSTPYSELLKDPRWQKKRLEAFERDGWRCANCSSTTETLHVHHKRYERSGLPWESPLEDLQTLCEGCHASVTAITRYVRARLGELEENELGLVAGILRALELAKDPGLDSVCTALPPGTVPASSLAAVFGLRVRDVAEELAKSPQASISGQRLWEMRRAYLAKEPTE